MDRRLLSALCSLPVVGAAVLPTGCSGSDDHTALPPSSSAEIAIVGGARFLGAFIVEVGPFEGSANFEWSGRAVAPTPDSQNIVGRFLLSPGGLERTVTGDTVEYHPTDPWQWVVANRGGVGILGASTARNYIVRDFSYRADPDRRIAVTFVGVAGERIDLATRTVLPGDDLVVEVTGQWTGSCLALDERGRVINDPRMILNPLCRELLSPPSP